MAEKEYSIRDRWNKIEDLETRLEDPNISQDLRNKYTNGIIAIKKKIREQVRGKDDLDPTEFKRQKLLQEYHKKEGTSPLGHAFGVLHKGLDYPLGFARTGAAHLDQAIHEPPAGGGLLGGPTEPSIAPIEKAGPEPIPEYVEEGERGQWQKPVTAEDYQKAFEFRPMTAREMFLRGGKKPGLMKELFTETMMETPLGLLASIMKKSPHLLMRVLGRGITPFESSLEGSGKGLHKKAYSKVEGERELAGKKTVHDFMYDQPITFTPEGQLTQGEQLLGELVMERSKYIHDPKVMTGPDISFNKLLPIKDKAERIAERKLYLSDKGKRLPGYTTGKSVSREAQSFLQFEPRPMKRRTYSGVVDATDSTTINPSAMLPANMREKTVSVTKPATHGLKPHEALEQLQEFGEKHKTAWKTKPATPRKERMIKEIYGKAKESILDPLEILGKGTSKRVSDINEEMSAILAAQPYLKKLYLQSLHRPLVSQVSGGLLGGALGNPIMAQILLGKEAARMASVPWIQAVTGKIMGRMGKQLGKTGLLSSPARRLQVRLTQEPEKQTGTLADRFRLMGQ